MNFWVWDADRERERDAARIPCALRNYQHAVFLSFYVKEKRRMTAARESVISRVNNWIIIRANSEIYNKIEISEMNGWMGKQSNVFVCALRSMLNRRSMWALCTTTSFVCNNNKHDHRMRNIAAAADEITRSFHNHAKRIISNFSFERLCNRSLHQMQIKSFRIDCCWLYARSISLMKPWSFHERE